MSVIGRAKELRKTIEGLASSHLDDTAALKNTELFPVWVVGKEYKVGERVRYENTLYKVLQDHTAHSEWDPNTASSLFAKVLIPDSGIVSEWEQPESTNGYDSGDRVLHDGTVWESLVDDNVWEPGTTGTEAIWRKIE